jgi:O-succinylbenzoic acid--CoA ligase
VSELVALDMPIGAAMVDRIRRAHDRGHAVSVIDQRVSDARRREIIESLAPTRVIDANGAEAAWPGRPVEPGDGAVVATSGSSGPPKFAVLSWAAVIASAELTTQELYRGRPTVWNACLPASHIGGFAVLTRSIFTDDRLVFGDVARLDEGAALGATHVAVVRTHLHRFDLSGYRVVLLGGSKPPGDVPGNVVTTWGMTETGSGVVYNGWPLPGVEVAEVDGELLVRSATLLRAYRDGTSPLVVGPDGRPGWLATGDGGTVSAGSVAVRGRLEYVIATGGEKVWPEDVEAVICEIEDVTDCAVVGVDDAEWGERVVAFVVSPEPSAWLYEAIDRSTAERIGPWAAPKEVRAIDAIPRTDNGKIRRDELAALARAARVD